MLSRILIYGTGGELVQHGISKEAFDYWSQLPERELKDYILDPQKAHAPDFADFAEGLDWWELDNLSHFNGPEPLNSTLVIETFKNENQKKVLDTSFYSAVSKMNATVNAEKVNFFGDHEYMIQIYSYEKGGHYSSEDFEVVNKFDYQELEFVINSFNNEQLITRINYKGKELLNEGDITQSKGIYISLHKKE